MKKFKIIIATIFLILNFQNSFSQVDSLRINDLTKDDITKMTYDDLLNLSLEQLVILSKKLGVSVDELLNMKITVSSKKALTTRESPGIVTVVTDEEIRKSGARDLIDVLNAVPGFFFGYDVDGIIGIGSRGNWGHEGKILLLIDGQIMNDFMYSVLQFANHYNINQIKRIEIIRGPGSVIYGGDAELGVINIITKNGSDLNGIEASGQYGLFAHTTGNKNISLSFGKKYNDLDVSVSLFKGTGRMSDETYTSMTNYSYGASSKFQVENTENLNIGLAYNGLKARFIFDDYQTFTTDNSDSIETPASSFNRAIMGELKYDIKINDRLTITPQFNINYQKPFQSLDTPYWSYNKQVIRSTGSIGMNYDVTKQMNLIAGFELYKDDAKNFRTDSTTFFQNGKNEITYNNFSVYLQGLYKTKYLNFFAGGRMDKHSEYGNAFSPRVGITGLIDKFHFKLLYSRAFRAPSIENMLLNTKIVPEKTDVFELELGYQLNNNMFITANLYDITIHDPIVYNSYMKDSLYIETYTNFTKTGSQGIEIEYRFKYTWGYATLNYSYYTTNGKNEVAYYQVTGNNNAYLAAPQNKITLNSCFDVFKDFSVSPSFNFFGKRSSYTTKDSISSVINPTILINLYFNYSNLFTKGLNLGFGIYNIFDKPYQYIQPYNGGHSPYPAQSREFVVKLTYELQFNN